MLYARGAGIPRNSEEAVKWYLKAAKQGQVDAQYDLATAYYMGDRGVARDDKTAFVWLTIALPSLRGVIREFAIGKRDLIAEKLTPEQLAEAQKIAAEWKPR